MSDLSARLLTIAGAAAAGVLLGGLLTRCLPPGSSTPSPSPLPLPSLSLVSFREIPPIAPAASEDWSILFLGTGVSGALPRLQHTVTAPLDCETCIRGLRTLHPETYGNMMTTEFPPHLDDCKNVRGNVQLCLRLPHPDGRRRIIVIDCGKTSRSAMNTYFPKHGIAYVDAVCIRNVKLIITLLRIRHATKFLQQD
jgi:hypothetical protein